MTQQELNEILKEHKQWLNDHGGKRADLRYAQLSGLDLNHADLSWALLDNANLSFADLSNADLKHSKINSTDFSDADLSGADLSHTDLIDVNLTSANLNGSNLVFTKFVNADLSNTHFFTANLTDTQFKNCINTPYIPLKCPEEGSFIGWKKGVYDNYCDSFNVLIKLQIPASAKRLSGTSEQCRCDKAKVLGIYSLNAKKLDVDKAFSIRDPAFEYKVGKTVYADSLDEDRWNPCSNGIHFFMDKRDAISY